MSELIKIIYIYMYVCLSFLGLHPWHMEVPRLGVELELKLPATATWDPSCVCALHHSSQKCQILNPQSEARDRTLILMDPSQVGYHWAMAGTLWKFPYWYIERRTEPSAGRQWGIIFFPRKRMGLTCWSLEWMGGVKAGDSESFWIIAYQRLVYPFLGVLAIQ